MLDGRNLAYQSSITDRPLRDTTQKPMERNADTHTQIVMGLEDLDRSIVRNIEENEQRGTP